ncbi:MAG: methylated-DNA--[protein]-cysteine S-methyltransferase [Planctomycetota bacterium]
MPTAIFRTGDTRAERLDRLRMLTPIGEVELAASPAGLRSCKLIDAATGADSHPARHGQQRRPAYAHVARASRELSAYFAGDRSPFSVALDPPGTDFQRAVWDALREIPCGQTRSYAALARAICRPAAVRAVGRANGANPLWIIVPCHRVIGSDGSLTGYAGGVEVKRRLLAHEGSILC